MISRVCQETVGRWWGWRKVCVSKRKMQTKPPGYRQSLKKFGQKPISRLQAPVFASHKSDCSQNVTTASLAFPRRRSEPTAWRKRQVAGGAMASETESR